MNRRFEHYPPGSDSYIDHPSQARPGIHPYPDRLHVLTMLSNPLRFRKRYENYSKFEWHMEQGGAILYTAEIALGGRKFEITEAGNPRHLQLRSAFDAPWFKENALNLLAARLPQEAQSIGVFDADIHFARADWAQEILHSLQHHDVIQPFSFAQDLGPDDEPLPPPNEMSKSFMCQYVDYGVPPHEPEFLHDRAVRWTEKGVVVTRPGPHPPHPPHPPKPPHPPHHSGTEGWHPGLAWAFRRSAWDAIGGMPDWLPTGSGDWHLANALIGNLMRSVDPRHSSGYLKHCKILQRRCEPIRNNPAGGLGYVPGLILHSFHGTKHNRKYEFRHQFIINVEFDPDLDLRRDIQGLWQLTDRNHKLRDGLRLYAKMRSEDSTTV